MPSSHSCSCWQLESIELPMENKTNKRRGFCFITFKDEDSVKNIMLKKYHNIGLSKVTKKEKKKFFRNQHIKAVLKPNSFFIHSPTPCLFLSVWNQGGHVQRAVPDATALGREGRLFPQISRQGYTLREIHHEITQTFLHSYLTINT